MLYFLAYAAKAGFTCLSYEDNPEGKVEKNEAGDPWVSAITLRPNANFTGHKCPTGEEIERLHHRAQELHHRQQPEKRDGHRTDYRELNDETG